MLDKIYLNLQKLLKEIFRCYNIVKLLGLSKSYNLIRIYLK
jgi:hypothetical protein